MDTLLNYALARKKRGPAGAQKQLVEVTVHWAKGEHKSHRWKLTGTNPIARKKTTEGKEIPGAPPGSQLPKHVLDRLKELGVSKLPAAHIKDVHINERLHDKDASKAGTLIKWTDDKGHGQVGRSAEAIQASHDQIFKRTEALRPKVPALVESLRASAPKDPTAAATLLIAQTGLRNGSDDNLPGHYGVLTMEARHVKFMANEAHIEYVGKDGKVNVATVTDPVTVKALKSVAAGKKPTDKIWPEGTNERTVQAKLLPKMQIKDLRTVAASNLAEKILSEQHWAPTNNRKADAKAVGAINKAVAAAVAAKLNNNPAQAFKSYIAPTIFQAWGAKHKVPAEWTKTLAPKVE